MICIIYYVTGCIDRSISRCNRCGSCKEALVLDQGIDIEDVCKIKDERDKLLKLADHGGLAAPTELCMSLCIMTLVLLLDTAERSNGKIFTD